MQLASKVIRQCYSCVFILALPLIILRLFIRSFKQPNYRKRIKERFAWIPQQSQPSILVHTVSVGETIAATPMIEALIQRFPNHILYVTTTTPSGSEQVRQRLGNRIQHSYLPYDIPWLIRRFLKRSRAQICLLFETEIWPNILNTCQQQKVPTLLINARLSEKSMLGYQRMGTMATDLMNQFSHIAAQSELDKKHFLALGVDKEKISVTGSIKFDHTPPDNVQAQASTLRSDWHATDRPIIIAASTRDGEESLVIDAFRSVLESYPSALLLIAPRHPDRFKLVYKLCLNQGFSTALKSDNAVNEDTQIIIGDTLGELMLLYATSDIAYVGGSLVPTGGHNILEPAMLAKPIITGPHLRNFKVISKLLIDANGLKVVTSTNELASVLQQLLNEAETRMLMGKNAKRVVDDNVGAMQRQLHIIEKFIT